MFRCIRTNTFRIAGIALLSAFLLTPLFGQMTRDQKIADFQQLAAVYVKNYKPYEWKMAAFGYDLFYITPWLKQVENSKSDLEFYDICVRYVAALKDSHDEFILPSDFEAWLPITVDIYDGKVLVDFIDRFVLPSSEYPIRVGDEVVALDGKPASQWLDELEPYSANGNGNDSARRRLAALTMVDRYQGFYPYAPNIGAAATVEIRSQDGTVASYTMPWEVYGTPLLFVSPVQAPFNVTRPDIPISTASRRASPLRGRAMSSEPEAVADENPVAEQREENPWGVYTGPEPARILEPVPAYLRVLRDLQTSEPAGRPVSAVASFGSRSPVFIPPPGFVRRLGGSSNDQILTGTFPVGSNVAGFIRLPTMSPSNQALAVLQFQNEIAYFNQNTKALVIDVMHNGGGSLCYVETLMRSLVPYPFRGAAYEIRATEFWAQAFSSSLWSAINSGADQNTIDLYTGYLAQVQEARKELRASTGNLPVCGSSFQDIPPLADRNGNILAYNKPILVLTNEFSLSAAEAFTGLLQDAGRITAFGTRTAGGGGNPETFSAGTYSMGQTRATRTLVTRAKPVSTPGLPAGNHMENIGVYPDIWNDIMTTGNLLTGGRPFVDAFVAAVADLIARNQ